MKNNAIQITNIDFARLSKLIMLEKDHHSSGQNSVLRLYEEIQRAEKVDPEKIQPDVVTMNSVVKFMDLKDNRSNEVKLVYPKDADIRKRYISVLAPVGIALLGYRKGVVVEWDVPAGKKSFRIEEIVYQPEAHGDYLS
jgi:regulator of nucleoside diphosphate kinase